MSTPSGAVAPYTIPGEVVQPDAVLDPQSVPAHNFFNTIRDLVLRAAYHTENEKHAALNAVDAFEHRFIPSQDRRHVVAETDHAGREDVSQRKPPGGAAVVVPPSAPQLDYGMLARAILQAQQEAEASKEQPEPPAAAPAE